MIKNHKNNINKNFVVSFFGLKTPILYNSNCYSLTNSSVAL